MKAINPVLILIIVWLLWGCKTKPDEARQLEPILNPIANLDVDSVCFIRIVKGGEVYEINGEREISVNLLNMQNSKMVLIKWGSSDIFTIFSFNGEVLIEGAFGDSLFKVDGVVFKAKEMVFDGLGSNEFHDSLDWNRSDIGTNRIQTRWGGS